MTGFQAYIYCYEDSLYRSAKIGFASCNEIGPRTAYGVFEDVGDEGGEEERGEEAEDRDVGFVEVGTDGDGPGDEDEEGKEAGINEEPNYNEPRQCMRMKETWIVKSEHAMPWLADDFDEDICHNEQDDAEIVTSIRLAPEPLKGSGGSCIESIATVPPFVWQKRLFLVRGIDRVRTKQSDVYSVVRSKSSTVCILPRIMMAISDAYPSSGREICM
nr:hypothetical protein CFP56_32319 [Quercus suber]